MDRPLTIADAAARLRSGTLTSVDLARAAIAQADRVDEKIGVYLHRRDRDVLADAEQADADLAKGIDRGPLHGIPLALKDVFATRDAPTTAQSLAFEPPWGEDADAAVVARLRSAGAIFTGKNTTMEFVTGCPDPDKPFPVPRNPWDLAKWAGGSSSGTASGIATGCFLGGVGTDTAGSCRNPAAMCGVTGLKPTYGRVPKTLAVPLSRSFDHVGPLARSARDCALLLQAMAGFEPSDPRSRDVPVPDYTAALDGGLEGLRIGVEREHHTRVDGVDPSAVERFERALDVLEGNGATVTEITIPYVDEVRSATAVAYFSEAFAYHRANLRRRWSDYGRDARLIIGSAALYSAADHVQAGRVIAAARRRADDLFRSVDLVVTPTVGAGAPDVDGLDFVKLLALPIFTPIWNALRNPVISVPTGFTASGLPVGMQIIGRRWEETTVLRAADAYQQRTDWHLRVPPIAA
ncbi:amidase [Actinomadura sp. B10D3]|uniref:amidase n=1 Tax=Actinomadura sp. B10D3 TaxID=3153557 RepID=UPI00325F1B92